MAPVLSKGNSLMLMLLMLAFLVFAGWSRWPWWTPVATFAVCVPVMLWQVGALNSWRGEAGLVTHGTPEIAASMTLTLVLYYMAYGLGFGAGHLARRT